ncbi:hypothetical protein QBC34DRAFT_443563 [Podospora aff. communis PSN243]|uniref:Uncharacterized protein n=1 Tax=Podospora aff. communis PSN243 TaxID=3040156 RepID=A0AAV9G5D9_9PEZI|nr:hypothetical protein QBC34DRAFT_443563 [Podospora aff. communis PSN243]
MQHLDEAKICADFDRRVDEGVIIFNKAYRTVPYSDNGFNIEFRLLSGLSRKPGVSTSTPPSTSPAENTGLLPGSDINIHSHLITALGTSHLLAFNKFSAARPHLLLLTADGYRRQHEALDLDDFTALHTVLSQFTSARYLAIYNCGVNSGCSRLHKHMQVFRAPSGFSLWPDEDGEAALPFRYVMARFEGGLLPRPEELRRAYEGLLREAGEALGWDAAAQEQEGEEAPPHNVVLDGRWMVVVPRRAPGWNGADANAAAVLGMVWVSDEERMRRWVELGPGRVMAELGVPVEARGDAGV